MPKHVLEAFGGIYRRSNVRNMAGAVAERALNVKLWRGTLAPWRQPKLVLTHTECISAVEEFDCSLWTSRNPCASFARDMVCGLVYGTDVDDYKYPVVSRDVCAGSMEVANATWVRLGVPKPDPLTFDVPALAAPDSKPTPGRQLEREHRDYVYTYVNSMGDEGQPSDPSPSAQDADASAPATLRMPPIPSGRDIVAVRVYRVQTGNIDGSFAEPNNGVFLFAEEIPVAEGTSPVHVDNVPVDCLMEPVHTTCHAEPPKCLSGITPLEQGGLVGFEGRNLWFSERFQPHAWPCHLTLDDCIRSVHEVSGQIYVVTDGNPYIVSSVSDEEDCKCCRNVNKLTEPMPLVSDARGVVKTPTGVMWPSTYGVARLSGGTLSLMTHDHIPEDEWLKWHPSTLKMETWNGRLFGFGAGGGFIYDYGDGIYKDGDVGSQSRLTELSYRPDTVFKDSKGNLYLVFGDQVRRWNDGAEFEEYVWRSQVIGSYQPTAWSVVQVLFERGDCGGSPVDVSIFDSCDILLDVVTVHNEEPVRLKGGLYARAVRVEIRGTAEVSAVAIATGIGELR